MQERAGGELWRVGAFTDTPDGGNPAGVWVGDALPDAATMQQIAAEVGYSETAFVAPASGFDRTIRYFSPLAEVSFCGHATIATGAVLAQTDTPGRFTLQTSVGDVPVDAGFDAAEGTARAALTSVEPAHEAASDTLVADALSALGWNADDLDPTIPPARAYAGAWHLVVAVRDRKRLAALDYDFDALSALMAADGLTTLQLIWRESSSSYWSRNPFPPGGVIEDPATGAAAAALGGYLRDAGLVDAPADVAIHQGHDMGRPSLLDVTIPATGGITVAGTAVAIEG